jgi:hypothetical protein
MQEVYYLKVCFGGLDEGRGRRRAALDARRHLFSRFVPLAGRPVSLGIVAHSGSDIPGGLLCHHRTAAIGL